MSSQPWTCRACGWAWPHENATHEPVGYCLECGAIDVLDHGYLKLVESYGSDEAIVTAARQSTQKGFLGWGPSFAVDGEFVDPDDVARVSGTVFDVMRGPHAGRQAQIKHGDEKLLRFMWEHQHSTPFEFAGAVIEVQAPIFVFREWHRHRTQSYSEASARYSPLPDVNYIPTIERLMMNAGTSNRQAGTVVGSEELTVERAETCRGAIGQLYSDAQAVYEGLLKRGTPKELARLVLPVGRYSRMRASANLRNWLAFLTLRQAPSAQFEIREYANALHDVLAAKFPRTLTLFDEGKKS